MCAMSLYFCFLLPFSNIRPPTPNHQKYKAKVKRALKKGGALGKYANDRIVYGKIKGSEIQQEKKFIDVVMKRCHWR